MALSRRARAHGCRRARAVSLNRPQSSFRAVLDTRARARRRGGVEASSLFFDSEHGGSGAAFIVVMHQAKERVQSGSTAA